MNGCTGDWLAPPVLTTIIVVATINMAEIGDLLKGFRGCLESPLEATHLRENQQLQHCQYDLGIAKLESPAMMKEC